MGASLTVPKGTQQTAQLPFLFDEIPHHFDGLVQERRNSIANALELRLSCTNPLILCLIDNKEDTCITSTAHWHETIAAYHMGCYMTWFHQPSYFLVLIIEWVI